MASMEFGILEKLLSNRIDTLSKQEYRYLLSLFEDEGNPDIKEWLSSQWEKAVANPELDSDELDYVLQRIKLQIRNDIVVKRVDTPQRRFMDLIHKVQRVAAVLLIPVAIFVAYLFLSGKAHFQHENNLIVANQKFPVGLSQEYYSPAGTRSKVVLGDSTTVWLNSQSRLEVFNGYGGKSRRVKLVGQAYFDVKKNPSSPFIVDLPHGKSIKVTGTVFTVGAYEDSRSIETVLISGTVFVSNGNEVVKMAPSQKVSIDISNDNLSIAAVSDESYKSWKDGVLIFKETPMPEVVATLEKWFNVKIQVLNSEVMSYRFTAKLDNCSLTQVMDYMSYSSPIAYNIKEQNVTLKLR